ncbi:MAG TPA: hypothetical protein VGW37_12775 [Terriglobia bacterium]|nr:hypothetical protein [Terriglobia bacterium]
MDNEKRVMIAFALSFVLLLLWRVMFVKTPPPAPKPSGSAHPTAQQSPGEKQTGQTAAKPEVPKLPLPLTSQFQKASKPRISSSKMIFTASPFPPREAW